jgi:hypothetical protein
LEPVEQREGGGVIARRDLSRTDDGIFIGLVGFFLSSRGWGMRVCFPLISGHLVSEVGDVLIDLSCHCIFTGSLCERDPCTMLGEVGRLARRTLQAAAGDHNRDRAFLDEVVGGGSEQDAGRRG